MFLNPVMLAGAGAAVVPLVLHFLSRSRFRTVDWGGMMFLGEPGDRRLSGGKMKQWVLLLLRMGILGLLAVAMARPVVAKLWGDRSQRRLIVLVVDCSGSMSVQEAGGRSRMDLAKEEALRVLARAHAGDRAALVVMGAGEVKASPVEELGQITRRIDTLHHGSGLADVAKGLMAAADLCDRRNVQTEPSAEIYIIADRQARSWEGVGDAFTTAWRGRWSHSKGSRARLYIVPVGREGVVENVGMESLEITDGLVVRGQPVGVEVRVHNYGGRLRTGVPVTISAAGQPMFETTVNLEAGATETVRTTAKFANGGRQTVSAELRVTDPLSDNRLELPMDVREPLNVALMCGDEQRDGKFIRLALAPFAGKDAANLAKVTLVKGNDPAASLAGADVLILADVIQPVEGMVSRIEQYVYGGGGLIIALGSSSVAAEYTRLLYRNGAGVMPAALRSARGSGEGATTLLGLALEHPVFRFLKGMASPVPLVSIAQYFPADLREGDSRVLGSYATGDPFLIEGSFGSGRVLLVTTSLNAEWSDLPWTNFYLPFMQSCVRYVSKGGGAGVLKIAGSGESDLTPLGDESWERLRRSLEMEEISDASESGGSVLLSALGAFESELWLPLLGCVIGLMILESLLGRAWSEGSET